MLPAPDAEPWPTLGPDVCAFIENNLCHGPGDLLGEVVELNDEQRGWIYRMYEVVPEKLERRKHRVIVNEPNPDAGKRRFQRCALSLRKGSSKTEFAAWIAAAELHPDGPVRCAGSRRARGAGAHRSRGHGPLHPDDLVHGGADRRTGLRRAPPHPREVQHRERLRHRPRAHHAPRAMARPRRSRRPRTRATARGPRSSTPTRPTDSRSTRSSARGPSCSPIWRSARWLIRGRWRRRRPRSRAWGRWPRPRCPTRSGSLRKGPTARRISSSSTARRPRSTISTRRRHPGRGR
jgi:hypothetical protein